MAIAIWIWFLFSGIGSIFSWNNLFLLQVFIKFINNSLWFCVSGISGIVKHLKASGEERKNILMAKGIPENKQYLLESISQNENRTNYLNKKKKREIKGNDLFTTEAYYRAYKKRSKVLPFDKDLYDDEMENGINKNKIQNDIKKELLGNDMKAQIEKRAKFSRRRPVLEEDEVDYINERNQKYNQKLKRFFGKESKEVKNNM